MGKTDFLLKVEYDTLGVCGMKKALKTDLSCGVLNLNLELISVIQQLVRTG